MIITVAETSYRVDEDDDTVQIALRLSQPAPQDFTVNMSSSDITATRKCQLVCYSVLTCVYSWY